TGICLISRDTFWYAASLLFDNSPGRRELGQTLAGRLRSEDGTHTPATILAMILGIPELLSRETQEHLARETIRELVHAAEVQWRDGNVNHPLGAYCTLILGGELADAPWAADLGLRRLREFQRLTGDRRFAFRRQAEMSEYNSPTYTALDILFLALIAHYARGSEARALGLFLEQRLWLDVALHFHAPSEQFAGPHSRSYQDDSTGGFSALHTVLFAASDREMFLAPEICVRFNHPSSLLQCALTALVPTHCTDEALRLAWEKPFPFLMQKTTYCEQYHENSWRTGDDGRRCFAFDDEVYPGGLRELTTYMTEEFALGTASLPYVNGGHADGVTFRIRRSSRVRGMGDFRSAYTRGVYNGALVGQRNRCHLTGTEIDESYLYEEGRCAALQHHDRAIVMYAPKRSGHTGVESFRLDLIFSYHAPFDELLLDGVPVTTLPARAKAGARLYFRDHATFGAVIPLGPEPASGDAPVSLHAGNDHLMYSLCSYDGPARDFTREEIAGWRTGFALQLASADEFPSFASFITYAGLLHAVESGDAAGIRRVIFSGPGGTLAAAYDPTAERFLSRTWNGSEECVEHLRIEGGVPGLPLITPLTLFGSEAMQQRT
ncbi:MAG TPA: hypothetical protein VF514_09975, partial [Bacteroidota bacterium]